MSQYKYKISELIFSLHCHLWHLLLECDYNAHGTYGFFPWIVFILMAMILTRYPKFQLFFLKNELFDHNFYSLYCKSTKDRNTLYLHSAARCNEVSHCGLCHNSVGQEVAVLKWLSTYPHHLELLSDIFLPFSFKAVRKSQNISDLLQNLNIHSVNVIQHTQKTSFFSLHSYSGPTIPYLWQDIKHSLHVKTHSSQNYFQEQMQLLEMCNVSDMLLQDCLFCAKELDDITHSPGSFQYSFCL